MNTTINNQPKVIFETGATSHAVNDLILFTDNTRELARIIDVIYTDRATNVINDYNMFYHFYYQLYSAAIASYRKELGKNYTTFRSGKEINAMRREFSELYVADFKNWKKEHGY